MAPKKAMKKAGVSTKSKTIAKQKINSAKKNNAEKDNGEKVVAENVTIAKKDIPAAIEVSTVDRVFQTVTIDQTNIGEGVFLLRQISSTRFEIVNISKVAHHDLTSEEVGERFNAIPRSLELLKNTYAGLGDITLKLGQAVQSAEGTIFRFSKLPLELRYRIYEFALIGDNALFYKGRKIQATSLALGLLCTCRWVNLESMPFFWRNTFSVTDLPKSFDTLKPYFMSNVRHAEFEWFGLRMKDPITIQLLHGCKRLESLHVILTGHCGTGGAHNRPQFLYQNDQTIKAFSRTNGFDKLISLHGLKEVIVTRKRGPLHPHVTTASTSEIDIFEKFLIKKLTEPIYVPPPPKPRAQSSVQTSFQLPQPSTPTRKSSRLSLIKPIRYNFDEGSDEDSEVDSDEKDDE